MKRSIIHFTSQLEWQSQCAPGIFSTHTHHTNQARDENKKKMKERLNERERERKFHFTIFFCLVITYKPASFCSFRDFRVWHSGHTHTSKYHALPTATQRKKIMIWIIQLQTLHKSWYIISDKSGNVDQQALYDLGLSFFFLSFSREYMSFINGRIDGESNGGKLQI